MVKFMQAIISVVAELFGLLKIWRQNKQEEVKAKQKEIFVERAKNQQEVQQKDKDEQLISEVVSAPTPEERKKRLDEIRKIISK